MAESGGGGEAAHATEAFGPLQFLAVVVDVPCSWPPCVEAAGLGRLHRAAMGPGRGHEQPAAG